jgi:hypothetical protein
LDWKGDSSLEGQHKAELQKIKAKRKGGLSGLSAVLFSFVVVCGSWILISGSTVEGGTDLIRLNGGGSSAWLMWYLEREQALADFLWYYALPPERFIFVKLSDAILASAAGILGPAGATEPGIAGKAFLSLHLGILHAAFVIVACWRGWLAYVLYRWVASFLNRGVYEENDFLGQLGNGRLFYSGIRAGLFKLAPNGAPDMHARGVVCLPEASAEQVLASSIYETLVRYDAVSETNKELIAYIIADPKFTAFAARPGEDALLQKRFEGVTLPVYADLVLERALFLHAHYRADVFHDAAFYEPLEELHDEDSEIISLDSHIARLLASMNQVLTDSLKMELRTLTPAQIATVVLSYEAGKILAYSFEGGKWICKSSFTELSARAVLHSTASYGKEFDYFDRETVRQAIIYGSRFSVLGPVRFPTGMSGPTRAARQWVELLMALPHELQASCDEVELVGIVQEVYSEWVGRFTERLQAGDGSALEGLFVGPSEVLYVPLSKLLSALREIVPPDWIERIGELVGLVSQKQRLQVMSADLSTDQQGDARSIPAYQRILPPLTLVERRELASTFKLSEEDVRDWCRLRVVLNSYSWLARRVGNRSVPESSVIFCVFVTQNPEYPPNARGRSGAAAMVPLRGMRLESRIGRNWASRFPEALTVRLAETRPEYQQLLTKKKLDADFAETETEVDAEETEGRQLEAGDDVVDRILRED